MSCCCSVAKSCPTLFDCMGCSIPGFSVLQCLPELLKFMSTESVMSSNHLILCHPFLLLPSVFTSIRVFSKELALHIRWPKDWSFSFIISLSKNIKGWFPLGWTGLISLLSKGLSRVFSCSTIRKHHFFGTPPSMVQFSHLYMITGKTAPLTTLLAKWCLYFLICCLDLS